MEDFAAELLEATHRRQVEPGLANPGKKLYQLVQRIGLKQPFYLSVESQPLGLSNKWGPGNTLCALPFQSKQAGFNDLRRCRYDSPIVAMLGSRNLRRKHVQFRISMTAIQRLIFHNWRC